jgi:hypothetical protein
MAMFIGVTLAFSFRFIKLQWVVLITAFITVLMLLGVTNVWQLGNYNKNSHASNNTKQIIEKITSNSDGKQPIIAATPWLFYEAVFYSTDNHPVYFIDPVNYSAGSLEMLKDNDQHKIKTDDVAAFTQKNSTFWYVGYTGSSDLKAPHDNWQVIKEVSVNDSVSNGPAYKAIEFKTIK